MSPKYIRIVQKEGVPSLVVCDGFVNILFFLVYINRMFRTFFLLQQSPEGQRRWCWWWENWNTRGKSFFRSENSSFSKLLSFYLQHSSTLFCHLILLKFYVFLCVCVWGGVCLCVCVCLCCWKNRLRYQKTAVLGWGKHFLCLFNTSTVYNNICFLLLCSIFIVI